jgi:NADP-dependent aldehyde dehydrogenase
MTTATGHALPDGGHLTAAAESGAGGSTPARAARCAVAFAGQADRARAALLRDLAAALEADRAALIAIGDRETSLGPARLSGELDRTAFQLRAFADHIAEGAHRQTLHQPAVAGPPPASRPALVRTRVPIGPVVVFAPSNFPLAFSVLGGDTAAALAAGNPVIVKGHRGHPELSLAVWQLAQAVIARHGLDADVLQLVQGASRAVGLGLVTAPEIAAVGFTGSLAAGRDLMRAIATRVEPIPFYGELSSINPVVAFPGALAAHGPDLAGKLAASITLGSGQFCTSPGVVVALDDAASRAFLDALAAALGQAATHPMLTAGTREQFEDGVARAAANPRVARRAGGPSQADRPAPTLVEVTTADFLADPSLRDEVFGPFCVAVVARDTAEIAAVLDAVGGSLTTTIWAEAGDAAAARPVVARAIAHAGRVLFSGVPTGVAVTAAQQHGGPWPSSSRPDTTSVGLAAIDRFTRPVALQDLPDGLDVLPPALGDALGVASGDPASPATGRQ